MKKFLLFLILFLSCKSKILALEPEKLEEKLDFFASKIISNMTDEEKAGQVIHISIPKNYLDEVAISEIKKIKPGGIILFGVNLGKEKEIRNLNKALQNEMKTNKLLPLLISTDQEGGRVIRVESSVTSFPGAMAIGQTLNKNFSYDVGFITSFELRRVGINLLLAPILDINNNPENPVINTRSFGMDLLSSEIAIEYEKGARFGGATPVIKHFPGHGDTTVDSHLGLPIIHKTEEELEKFELVPFKKSIDSGALALMSAHIVYPKLDEELPSTLSKKILTDLLRKKMNYKGLVLTDAMEMDAISKNYQDKKTGTLAIQAGADIILLTSFGKNSIYYYQMILDSIKNKEFNIDGKNLLDESLKRQIKLKLKMGLFHTSYSYLKIEDKEFEEYIKEKRKVTREKYEEYKKNGIVDLNKKISFEAIKSFKDNFKPLNEEERKKSIFVLKNEVIQSEVSKLGNVYFSESTLKKVLRKNKTDRIIFDSRDQNDLDSIKKIIEKEKKREILILHIGSPFLDFPKSDNVKIIFSFSPTKESTKAIIKRSLNSEKLIERANLKYKSLMYD